jgi:protein-disulfide isomerase
MSQLKPPVGANDHVQGPAKAPVTIVEYGDYECPYCGQAYPITKALQERLGDQLRFVFRNFPLAEAHPHAEHAAEAAEAAAAQGKFWEMYDTLLSHQDALLPRDLARYADQLGLDVDRFEDELRTREYASRVGEDVASADESGVSGTPTFFINGRRHYGVYDIDTLTEAVKAAKTRARQLAATAVPAEASSR